MSGSRISSASAEWIFSAKSRLLQSEHQRQPMTPKNKARPLGACAIAACEGVDCRSAVSLYTSKASFPANHFRIPQSDFPEWAFLVR